MADLKVIVLERKDFNSTIEQEIAELHTSKVSDNLRQS